MFLQLCRAKACSAHLVKGAGCAVQGLASLNLPLRDCMVRILYTSKPILHYESSSRPGDANTITLGVELLPACLVGLWMCAQGALMLDMCIKHIEVQPTSS